MTETLTDIQGLVDGAYSEMECGSRQQSAHGGDAVAVFEQHGCIGGPICEKHYKVATEGSLHAEWIGDLAGRGYLLCTFCKKRFYSVDDFVRYYPL